MEVSAGEETRATLVAVEHFSPAPAITVNMPDTRNKGYAQRAPESCTQVSLGGMKKETAVLFQSPERAVRPATAYGRKAPSALLLRSVMLAISRSVTTYLRRLQCGHSRVNVPQAVFPESLLLQSKHHGRTRHETNYLTPRGSYAANNGLFIC